MALVKLNGNVKFQGKTVFRPIIIGGDVDAERYILSVEEVDGQELEPTVRTAIGNFVVGCKEDGIWDTIKASCILVGARTLDGALVPLAGASPTNNNFVSADYDRKTGLKGNSSNKNLNANRNHTADDPEQHLFAYISEAHSTDVNPFKYTITSGNNSYLLNAATTAYHRAYGPSSIQSVSVTNVLGGYAVSRFSPTQVSRLLNEVVSVGSSAYQAPTSGNILIFGPAGTTNGNARVAFYSIGSNTNLADLNSRVSTLMSDLEAAI